MAQPGTAVAALAGDACDFHFFADPAPLTSTERLRHLAALPPVHFHDELGMWVVTKHDLVRSALLDSDTFRPDNVLSAVTRLSWRSLRVLAKSKFDLPPTLANNGGADHLPLRRLVGSYFDNSHVAAALPLITRYTDEALDAVQDELRATGRADLWAIARDVPIRTVLAMTGMPGTAVPDLARWTWAALELFWGRPDDDRQQELASVSVELFAWLSEFVRSRPADEPGLLGALRRHRKADGQPLTVTEIVAVYYFLVIAGQVTTTQLLGSLFRRVLGAESLWARIAAGREDPAGWTEEVLRQEPPLTTWRRMTSRPARLGGSEIPAGASVLLVLAAANNDADVFPDPERLCPHRDNARRHLAFGVGKHLCVGAQFARVEANTVLSRTCAQFPDLRLARVTASDQPPLLSFRRPESVLVEPTPRTGGARP